MVQEAGGGSVALGADLPIGLPRAYAATRPEADFPAFLRNVHQMPDFFSVCPILDDIGPHRPFYPARGIGVTSANRPRQKEAAWSRRSASLRAYQALYSRSGVGGGRVGGG